MKGIYQKPVSNFQDHAQNVNMPCNVENNSRRAAMTAKVLQISANVRRQEKEIGWLNIEKKKAKLLFIDKYQKI